MYELYRISGMAQIIFKLCIFFTYEARFSQNEQ